MDMTRAGAWQPSNVESAELVAGYRAAKALQVLPVPARLARELANYICRTDAALAERSISAAELTRTAQDSFVGLSDDEVAQKAREIRTEIAALPRTHPRRDECIAEWRRCIDELARRAVPSDR
jgi:hypothetical protein